MAYETIQVKQKNRIGYMVLNRPTAPNTLNTSMRQELHHFLTRQKTRRPPFKGR